MKRKINIQFNATLFVTQTIEVDTDMTDEEVLAGLSGAGTPIFTSLLEGRDVFYIPNQIEKIEKIGTVVESDYDDGEFWNFRFSE